MNVSELSHSDLLSIVANDDMNDDSIILAYLNMVAASFGQEEVFDMIAYVDTPDVLG